MLSNVSEIIKLTLKWYSTAGKTWKHWCCSTDLALSVAIKNLKLNCNTAVSLHILYLKCWSDWLCCAQCLQKCHPSAALQSGLWSYFLVWRLPVPSSGPRLAVSHSAPNLRDCLPACVCARRHHIPRACFGLCSQEHTAVAASTRTWVWLWVSADVCLRVCAVQNECVWPTVSWLAVRTTWNYISAFSHCQCLFFLSFFF